MARLEEHQRIHVVARRGMRLPFEAAAREGFARADRVVETEWIGALVEPPMAELTLMAFRNAARVRMRDGRRSSYDMPTMR